MARGDAVTHGRARASWRAAAALAASVLAVTACTAAPDSSGSGNGLYRPLLVCDDGGARLTINGQTIDTVRAWPNGVPMSVVDRSGGRAVAVRLASSAEPALPGAWSGQVELTGSAAPLAPGGWVNLPPGPLTATCLGPNGATVGAPARVTVADPDRVWREPAWDGLGCRPGGQPSWAISPGIGPTAAAAAADLAAPAGATDLPAVRLTSGYPLGDPQTWLIPTTTAQPILVAVALTGTTAGATPAPVWTAMPVTLCVPPAPGHAIDQRQVLHVALERLAATLVGLAVDEAVGIAERSGATTRVVPDGTTVVTDELLMPRITLLVTVGGQVRGAFPG